MSPIRLLGSKKGNRPTVSDALRDAATVPAAPPALAAPVVAYTTSWCPDCIRSKRLMQKMGVAFEEIDIETVEGAEEEMRARNGGSGKVPTIFIGGHVLIEPTDGELKRVIEEVRSRT